MRGGSASSVVSLSILMLHPHAALQEFTPLLAKAYAKINSTGQRFQVVYVSSDNDERMMYKYMNDKHGDWLAISFNDPMRQLLKKRTGYFPGKEAAMFKKMGVERKDGIPTLVLFSNDGEVLQASSDVGELAQWMSTLTLAEPRSSGLSCLVMSLGAAVVCGAALAVMKH